MAEPVTLGLDPRVERSRRLVLAAAIDLLGEVGYGGVTIEAVAARSGVAKSTIYRHWPDKLAIVDDALAELRPPFSVPAEGSVRERVVALLEQLATHVASSTWSSCLPALIEASERDPAVRALQGKISAERRALLVSLLREGVDAGELPAHLDPDLAGDCLAGAIFLRRLLSLDVMAPGEVRHLVAQLFPEG